MARRLDIELLTPSACLFLALALLTLPLRWVVGWCAAAAIHEGFHLLAVSLCRGTVENIRINGTGARIEVSDLTVSQQLPCTLAGPMGALLLLLFSKHIPVVAVCALFQSAYNLLPLGQLDGGRALRCMIQMVTSPRMADAVCQWVHIACLLLLSLFAIYAAIWLKLGLPPIILMLPLWKFGKIPCKQAHQAVQ